jgi:hypothetical protein
MCSYEKSQEEKCNQECVLNQVAGSSQRISILGWNLCMQVTEKWKKTQGDTFIASRKGKKIREETKARYKSSFGITPFPPGKNASL